MKRFFRKWYIRFVAYKVTMKYMPVVSLHINEHDFIIGVINKYVENIVYKDGRRKP
jgi:hypothetical protein